MGNPFFELIGVAVGLRRALTSAPSAAGWAAMYAEARRQTLVGVLYAALERLPAVQRPPREVLLPWYALAERIRRESGHLLTEAERLTERLEARGFDAVLLKGSGVAAYYPNPALRMPGDIDLWLLPKGMEPDAIVRGEARKAVEQFAASVKTPLQATWLHADLPLSERASVEVHFTPSLLCVPRRNARLQRWLAAQAAVQVAHRVPLRPEGRALQVPTTDFNRVYLLLHLYRHFLEEGVGLRQLMDYHYLLLRGDQPAAGESALLASLGLTRFAGAVGYVLRRLFGTPETALPAPVDASAGRFLLDEVMKAGNFGHYDARYAPREGETRAQVFLRKSRRSLRFFGMYPAEVAWSPLFRVWHYCWRFRRHYL